MRTHIWPPNDTVIWQFNANPIIACKKDISVDVAIIGGGMAGLAAAQAFQKRGKRVALCEQYMCGAGASGKSSGFVTPNAELSLTDMIARYGLRDAKHIWEFIVSGVHDIRTNILENKFRCDYREQDVLMLANSHRALRTLEREGEHLVKAGYQARLLDADALQEKLGSTYYAGALQTGDAFGINAYHYCQEMKQLLYKSGVIIYEETPVLAIDGHQLKTPDGTITAEKIIVCVDRFAPRLGLLEKEVYHAQTFVIASEQLSDERIHAIFPDDAYMAWDSELIYNYFRIAGDNRLILGGGTLFSTYSSKPNHDYEPIIKKLTKYWAQIFPDHPLQFEYLWPGLIGISKDIAPLAGRDAQQKHIYYVCAAAGLSIAAALGRYSAEHIIDGRSDLDGYFSPYRSFPIGGIVQSILGNKISFALSNVIKLNIP